MGGDEFSVIIQNDDYHNLDELIAQFDRRVEANNIMAQNPWNQVQLSKGFAIYNPTFDISITALMQRADKLMYENKRIRKSKQNN